MFFRQRSKSGALRSLRKNWSRKASCFLRFRHQLQSAAYIPVRILIMRIISAKNLVYSEHAVEKALEAIRGGASIVTDTQMGRSGINKKRLAQYGGQVYCFMSDEDVAQAAKKNGTTRAVASMKKACELNEKLIFAIGNAPTALIHLYELIKDGRIRPELVIGVPVGFVNVVQSKELILTLEDTPYIVARGRKGGSNIAACICNALIYML